MASSTNYYELLGVTLESTEKEIVKAYRKKALSCHPDKNPDNPKAAELFLEISEALKILTDKEAKAAFDKVLKAKAAARLRTQAFDAKRKKFKDDLEKRENDALFEKENDISAAEKLAKEIKRLREEGSRLLKEQQELLQKQLDEDKKNSHVDDNTPKLKVKWKSTKNDPLNGGYNKEIILEIFQKYGNVTNVVISRKNGLAIIEFEKLSHASIAFEFEKGHEVNPFVMTWLDSNAGKKSRTEQSEEIKMTSSSHEPAASNVNDQDFESIVLMRMRQAEERRRLTQQILEEDTKEQVNT